MEQLYYQTLYELAYNQATRSTIWAYIKIAHEKGKALTLEEFIQIQMERGNRVEDKKVPEAEKSYWAQHMIVYGDADYPKLWYQLYQPPILLFYQGNRSLLSYQHVSVVGSRKTTSYGREQARQLVSAFSKRGWVCVSGLAKGIDTIVHQTALESGKEKATIAIIASGLNRVYPRENADLQLKLKQHQLVLSEYLPDSPPLKHHFIMRNRLIAGISPLTCVIEAAQKSGSLITANMALQNNREVFALPGRVSDPLSKGCNELIAAGATPILSVEEVVQFAENLAQNQQYGWGPTWSKA